MRGIIPLVLSVLITIGIASAQSFNIPDQADTTLPEITDWGTLSGTVSGYGSGLVAAANIAIIGSELSCQTDINGSYIFSDLETGEYDLLCWRDGFIANHIENVIVNPNEVTQLNIYIDELCDCIMGDMNADGIFNGLDIIYAVNYFKGSSAIPAFPCYSDMQYPFEFLFVAGDVNGSCVFNGIDLTYMVGYLKGGPAPIESACLPNGALPPYSIIKGNLTCDDHTLTSHTFVVARFVHSEDNLFPWSRNLFNQDNSYNLLISALNTPRAIKIIAIDDIDTDGYWDYDLGDYRGYYDANGDGSWDEGDTLIIYPNQIIEGINITLREVRDGG
jgi:hypothetical protein